MVLSGIYTSVAWFTRSQMAIYITAIAAFVFVNIIEALKPIGDLDTLRVLLDYTGGSAAGYVGQFWSVTDTETRVLPLNSLFGFNRMIWSFVTISCLGLSGLYFKRRNYSARSISNRKSLFKTTKPLAQEIDTKEGLSVRPAKTSVHSPSQFWAWYKFEVTAALKSWSFITLLGLAVVSFVILVFLRAEMYPMPVLPTSNQIAFLVLNGFSLFLLLTIIFFSAQIVWRDKTAGLKEIIDVTPSHNAVHMAVKWSVLLTLVTVLLAAACLFAIVTQIVLGNPVIELRVYMARFVGNIGLYIVFMAILTLSIQTFVKDQKTGLVASGAVVFFFFMVMNRLPIHHPLTDFGSTNFGPYSDMNGFARQNKLQGLWRAAYWGFVCLMILILSLRLWPRGLETAVGKRFKNSRSTYIFLANSVFVSAVVGMCVTGGFIFHGFNVRNDFETKKYAERKLASYELQFGDRFDMPRPTITSLDLELDLWPETGAANIAGKMQWENKTNAEIAEVFVIMPTKNDTNIRVLNIEGAALNTNHPERAALEVYGYRAYQFTPPLKPGQSITADFDFSLPRPRLGDTSLIRKNGTFLSSYQILPTPGFETARLTLPRKRQKYGLPDYPEMAMREDMAARNGRLFNTVPDRLFYNATLCTSPEQIAITSGKQTREYLKNDRRCFDYENSEPVSGMFNISSGRYAVKTSRWKGVDLAVYYHPQHGYNIETMISAMKSGLETYSKTFGPYQYSQLKIAEYPYGSRAESFPNTIAFSENLGFVLDSAGADAAKGQIDLLSYITLHELGHQWFGHQMSPANVQGSITLTESLTMYAAGLALEDMRGWRMAKLMREQNLERYLSRRIGAPRKEVPLSVTAQEKYLVYAKGYVVFWALKHYLGEEVLSGGIRDFLEANTPAHAPYPTTLELISHIKARAPEKYHRLIDDYLNRIVIWELGYAEAPEITQGANGQTFVNVELSTRRYVSDKIGDWDEYVEIGFYDADPESVGFNKAFHIETVHVTSETQNLQFTLKQTPTNIVIDPRGLLIETNEKDNQFIVGEPSPQIENKAGIK